MNTAAQTGTLTGEELTVLPEFDCGGNRILSAAFSCWGAREYNEDRSSWIATGERACWVLADGLGGYHGGMRAAELAVDASLESFADSRVTDLGDALEQAVRAADARIRSAQLGEPQFAQMRSTLVTLSVSASRYAWAHAGDSRLYHFRDGELQWRTRDHSAVQLLVAAGELDESLIAGHPDRARLVSCLGGEHSLLISTRRGDDAPRAGDVFLLCSDGMWEHFNDADLQASLADCTNQPARLLQALAGVVRAAAQPDQDNYSAVAVMVS